MAICHQIHLPDRDSLHGQRTKGHYHRGQWQDRGQLWFQSHFLVPPIVCGPAWALGKQREYTLGYCSPLEKSLSRRETEGCSSSSLPPYPHDTLSWIFSIFPTNPLAPLPRSLPQTPGARALGSLVSWLGLFPDNGMHQLEISGWKEVGGTCPPAPHHLGRSLAWPQSLQERHRHIFLHTPHPDSKNSSLTCSGVLPCCSCTLSL